MSFTSEFLLRMFPKLGDAATAESALKKLVGDILSSPASSRISAYRDFLEEVLVHRGRKADQIRVRKILQAIEENILRAQEDADAINRRRQFGIHPGPDDVTPGTPPKRVFTHHEGLVGRVGGFMDFRSKKPQLTRFEPGTPTVVPARPDIDTIINNVDNTLRTIAARSSGLPEEQLRELNRLAIELAPKADPDPRTFPTSQSLRFQHAVPAPGARELIREGQGKRTVVMDLNTVTEILSSPTPGVSVERRKDVLKKVLKGKGEAALFATGERHPREALKRLIESEVELQVRQFMRKAGPETLGLDARDRRTIAKFLGETKPDGTHKPGALELILDNDTPAFVAAKDLKRTASDLGIGNDNFKRILVEAGIPVRSLGRLGLPENFNLLLREKRRDIRVEYVATALNYLMNGEGTAATAAFRRFSQARDTLKLQRLFFMEPLPSGKPTIIPTSVGIVDSITRFLKKSYPDVDFRTRDIVKFAQRGAAEADAIRPSGFGVPKAPVRMRLSSATPATQVDTEIFPLDSKTFGTNFQKVYSRGDFVQLNFKNTIVKKTFNAEEARSVFLVVDEVAALNPAPRKQKDEFIHTVALARVDPRTRQIELGSEVFLALPKGVKKTAQMPLKVINDKQVVTGVDEAGNDVLAPLADMVINPKDQAARFAFRLREVLGKQSQISFDAGEALYEIYRAGTGRIHTYTPDRELASRAMSSGNFTVRALRIGKPASFERGADIDTSLLGRLQESSRKLIQRKLEDIILEGDSLKSNVASVRNSALTRWARDTMQSVKSFQAKSRIVTSRAFLETLEKVSMVPGETKSQLSRGRIIGMSSDQLDDVGVDAEQVLDNILLEEGREKVETIKSWIADRILSGDKTVPQIKFDKEGKIFSDPPIPQDVLDLATSRALRTALSDIGSTQERRGLFRSRARQAMGEYVQSRDSKMTRRFSTVLDEIAGTLNTQYTKPTRDRERFNLIVERASDVEGAVDLTADALGRMWNRLEKRGYEYLGFEVSYEEDLPVIWFKAVSPNSGEPLRIRANITEEDLGLMINLKHANDFFELVEKELRRSPLLGGGCDEDSV